MPPLDCDSPRDRAGTVLVTAGPLVPPIPRPNNVLSISDDPLRKCLRLGEQGAKCRGAVVSSRGGGRRLEPETPEFKSPAQIRGLGHQGP